MIFDLLNAFIILVSSVVLALALIYSLECLLGAIPAPMKRYVRPEQRPSAAIVVPAHNEEAGIASTLAALKAELRPGDRLVVVADNCSDKTVCLARSAGVEVVERQNPFLRGKGYALSAGMRHLQHAPCPFVLIVDADCHIGPGTLDWLVTLSARTGQPVQARNLMTARPGASIDVRIAEFAFLVKNVVRSSGLARLGLPSPLQGTGMLFPWDVIRQVELATDDVVEDLKLSFDLAQMGYRPILCPEASVTSYFPDSAAGAVSQRLRWEGGHLNTIWQSLGHLARPNSVRSFPALVFLLDRMVPPTTLLFLAMTTWTLTTLLLWLLGFSPVALWLSAKAFLLASSVMLVVWYFRGRSILPARSLPMIPLLALRKLGFYKDLLIKPRPTTWVRTDRGK
jgi:cellulose synthase/poly-beta-1,6-N-acetylglucosamine synthase-like glycosyltransferase